jgi:hypothetical protein
MAPAVSFQPEIRPHQCRPISTQRGALLRTKEPSYHERTRVPIFRHDGGTAKRGKVEKKTLIPRMGPALEENLLSRTSTYERNIQTGKSKKKTLVSQEGFRLE